MIDELRALAIFAKVAEAGSFSAAANSLQLSTSVVSHHVKKLETRLGTTLIRRSTRALSLTHDGERLLESASKVVREAELGLNEIAGTTSQPSGVLRLTMPTFLSNSDLQGAVWRFVSDYPKVRLNIHETEERVNLISGGYDLAIRVGTLKDSGLKRRKIGVFERALVSSPSYLEKVGGVKTPSQLNRCKFVSLGMLPEGFTLHRKGKKVAFQPDDVQISVTSVSAAHSAIVAGLGIQRLPRSEVEEELKSGLLVEVLPDWSLPTLNIYAVWPEAGQSNALVTLLIDSLASVCDS